MARRYIPKYIRREAWIRITSVIRNYRQLKAEYEELRDGSTTCPTVRQLELGRKITAFETAYEKADKETRELVKQRFWMQRIYRDIFMPMSESTMKRCVRNFVIEVGQNLGEI